MLGGYPLIRLILSSVIIFDWVWHKFGTVIKDQRPFPFGWVLLQSSGGPSIGSPVCINSLAMFRLEISSDGTHLRFPATHLLLILRIGKPPEDRRLPIEADQEF